MSRRHIHIRRVSLVALLGVVVLLAGCGGSDESERGTGPTRGATVPVPVITLRVTNNTSSVLQGTPTSPEAANNGEREFRAEPGQRACVESVPERGVHRSVVRKVQSGVGGSAWDLSFTRYVESEPAEVGYTVGACGSKTRVSQGLRGDQRKVTFDVVCGGNNYRFTGNYTNDEQAGELLAEYTFADR